MSRTVKINIQTDADVSIKSVEDLRLELKSLEAEFSTLQVGTAEFNKLGQSIKGIRSELKNIDLQFEGLDKEQRATALVDTFNGLTGAIGAVSSAFIAFGAESEAIQDAEKKLLGVIGVVSGLRDVSNSLVAANKLLGGSFRAAFTTATGAINVTRVALAGLGIGAIIFAVTQLADTFDIFGTKAKENADKAEEALEKYSQRVQLTADINSNAFNQQIKEATLAGKTDEEVNELRLTLLKERLEGIQEEGAKLTFAQQKERDELIKIEKGYIAAIDALEIDLFKRKKSRDEKDIEDKKKRQEEANKQQIENAKQNAETRKQEGENERETTINLAEAQRKLEEQLTTDKQLQIEVTFQNNLERLKVQETKELEQENLTENAKQNIRDKFKILEFAAEEKRIEDLDLLNKDKVKKIEDEEQKLADFRIKIADAVAVSDTDQREREKQKIIEYYDDLIAEATKFKLDITALTAAKNEALEAKDNEYRSTDLEKDKRYRQQLEDLAIDSARSIIGDLQSLNEIFDESNERDARRAFERNQRLAALETILSTYSAASKAYSSQIIPFDPTSIIRAKIAAGVAIAGGLARLAVIRAQKFESSGTTGGAGGAGTGSTGTVTTGDSSSIINPFAGQGPGGLNILPQRVAPPTTGGTQGQGVVGGLQDAFPGGQAPVLRTYVLAGDVTDAQTANFKLQEKRQL